MGDGHLGKCKDCTKKDTANRIALKMNDPAWVEAELERHRLKQRRARAEGKACVLHGEKKRLVQERHRKKFPDKARARVTAQRAVSKGTLVRQPCEVCGATDSEKHHDDYNKPLDVRWLCPKHHAEHHVLLRRHKRRFLSPQPSTQTKDITMTAPRFFGFDIETKPLPELVDRYARPLPAFDEAGVKYGNTRDPAKRADLLASKRLEHEEAAAAHLKNLRDRAALDPFTGAIVCIGVIGDNGAPEILAEKTEEATLRQFWNLFALSDHATSKFVFWSGSGDPGKNFDLDFIVTRSRILHIELPHRVRNGRYYSDRWVDLAAEFLLYQRDKYLSLTKAADMFGLYEVNKDLTPKRDDDPVTGEFFWQWWEGVAVTDFPKAQQQALARGYLCNDLLHLKYLAPHILP